MGKIESTLSVAPWLDWVYTWTHLDMWQSPESASGSVYFSVLELIDYSWCFAYRHFIELTIMGIVRKSYVDLAGNFSGQGKFPEIGTLR